MMHSVTSPGTAFDITSLLRAWRTGALNTLLTATSVAAAPLVAFVVLEAVRNPRQWPTALIFVTIYLIIVALAVLRRFAAHRRAWAFLLLAYAAAVLAFARGGLAGDGRIYLLALPLLTMILTSLRSGMAMIALSLLTFAAFAGTAHLGWMEEWLIRQDNSLLLIDWAFGGISFSLTLTVLVVLQWQFNRFQETAVAENLRLYENSERLRTFNEDIVQGMEEGILLEDSTGHITFVNPKIVKLLGYTAEGLLGQHWRQLVAPEYVDTVEEEVVKRSRGIAGRYEAALLTREGRRVPVLVSARPLFDGERFTGVLTVITDITERKRAEEALRESEERYRLHFENVTDVIYSIGPDFKVLSISPSVEGVLGYAPEELIGASFRDLNVVAPDDLETALSNATRVLAGERIASSVYQFIARDGTKKFGEVSGAPLIRDGEIVAVVSVARDVTERERAQEELQEHSERLGILHEIDGAILAAQSSEEIAQAALRHIRRLVPCQHASVAVFDLEARHATVIAAHTAGESEVKTGARVSLEGAEADIQTLQRGEVRLAEDIWGSPHPSLASRAMRAEGLRSCIIAPLMSQQDLIGSLSLWSHHPQAFTPDHVQMAGELADSLTIAIQQARLFESVRRQGEQLRALTARLAEAEDAERRRLARELHDQVGKNLTVLGINLNLVRTEISKATELAHSRLDDSLALVEETTARIRDVMADLRPPMLDDYGLVAALHWYGEQFTSRTGIPITVEGEESAPRLAEAVENALFRISQEALTNVAKHARAAQARVTVTADDEIVRLVVADDGSGFDPVKTTAPESSQGWGLLTMTERAEAVGARLQIESRAQRGTQIIVEVTR